MKDKLIEEFDFVLTKKIPYSDDGVEVEGSFIKLTAPSSKQLTNCTELKQAFMRAIGDMDKKYTKEEIEDAKKSLGDSKQDMDGSGIMSTLYMSKNVDMVKVLISAIELFRTGVAEIEGKKELTKPLIDLMSQEDLERMTGEYMANFILRSVLKEMK